MRAPGIVRKNSAPAKDNVVVYICAPNGTIELAPDGRMTQAQLDKIGYKGWKRCEATGAREIEKLSLLLSRQAFEQKKKLKVQQHLRDYGRMEQVKANARINMAKNYSKLDVEANQRTIQRIERAESNFLTMIAQQFDPSARNTALQIEIKEQSTSPVAGVCQKQEGIA